MEDVGTLQHTDGFNITFDILVGEMSVSVSKKEVTVGSTVEIEAVSKNNKGDNAKANLRQSDTSGTKTVASISGSETVELELEEAGKKQFFLENDLAELRHKEGFNS